MKFDRSLIPPNPDLQFERELWSNGLTAVAGIDEAGRGALAGPVVAAAVILPPSLDIEARLHGVRDSKQMTPDQRQYWADQLCGVAVAFGVGFASSLEIDTLGIVPATCLASQRALSQLNASPHHLLLDYIHLPDCNLPQTSLVKGDQRCLSIAAASVLAKTSRDAWMRAIDQQYPGYGFCQNKGYGTLSHRQAIERLGPSPVHRLTFAPLQV